MDYEMETLIQAFEIQINMVWNQFHGIIHELIGYAHALLFTQRVNLHSMITYMRDAADLK